MEKIVEQGLLYDFYGELLTEHQKKIYEDVVYNDLSITEIAKENNVSRQGIHDLVRRCDHALQEYEDKLHLVERFVSIRNRVRELEELTEDDRITRQALIQEVKAFSHQILEEL
ncbi:MAG: DNA-binding protein [Bacillota bacterium]|nr:DNA-binding protein [Bacillota bacterium]